MKHLNNIEIVKKTSAVGTSTSFVKNLYKATSYGKTQNGALTLTRSGSNLLDFYAQAGSMRGNKTEALNLFKKAFAEDREKAVRVLFYLRDVRGGQGERDLFVACLEWLGTDFPDEFVKVASFVPEYGRWDDLFFDNEECLDLIKAQLVADSHTDSPSLLAKWLPTINASSPTTKAKAKFFAKALGYTEIGYRKLVRSIRKKIETVEEKMSGQDWDVINYSSVPSQAARIYKNAFKKHDGDRYNAFIEKAINGEAKINAATLYPYQIYKSVKSDYSKTLEALWNQLPDYTQGKNALVVADTSGSMSGDPMSVSVSLALYFAERNVGQFKDHFITFSRAPRLINISGKTLIEKMACIETGEVANTNLQAVFDLVLNTATANNTPAAELPATIYIISDMEFDSCTRDGWEKDQTNFEAIKEKYALSGYTMPTLVFWNVAASGKNLPAGRDENGVSLVSGFSPVIFKMAVENKTPEQVMLDTINSERYSVIKL